MFKDLPKLGTWIKVPAKVGNVYSCSATDGKDSAILLTHYSDNDATPMEQVKICLENVKSENGVCVEYYLLDDDHDAALVRKEIFTAESFELYLNMKLFDTYLIKIMSI